MKKGLIVTLGLMAVVLLSGCGNKVVDKDVNKLDGGETFDETYWNLSFTMDELKDLEERLFPVSYSYTTYQKEDWSVVVSGVYVYLPDDKYLLPVEGYVVEEELSSSEVVNDMVYSMVDAKLDNDNMVSILYINDPQTLKYAFATVYGDDETTLYTFNY